MQARRLLQLRTGPAQCLAITPTWGKHSAEDSQDLDHTHWILLSGHESGLIQLWGNNGEQMVALARITAQNSPCRRGPRRPCAPCTHCPLHGLQCVSSCTQVCCSRQQDQSRWPLPALHSSCGHRRPSCSLTALCRSPACPGDAAGRAGRNFIILAPLGLWATAHADGVVHLRQLRLLTSNCLEAPDLSQPLPTVNDQHPCAPVEVCLASACSLPA